MYFVLQSDIALAMEMPKPTIERIEYDLKDELIRQTIMDTQEDVDMILDKLEKQKQYNIYKKKDNNEKFYFNFIYYSLL